MRQKALDFEICASEFGFIEVEAKGAVTDSEGRSDLSNMKLHIERKKAIQRRQSDRPAIRIGVITSFRNQLQRPPLVRLLDPPAEPPTMDPGRFKLLARLNFYRRELNVISQAHFLSALATRISSLSMVKDFQALDEMPLLDGRGEPLRRPQLTSRSTVEHEYAFGEVVFIAELGLLFYGMRYEVVDLVLAQSHRAITDYQNPDLRVFRTITGRVLETELEGAGIDPGGYPRIPGTNRRRIQLTGHLYETTSGRVFGWVKERWSRS